MKVRTALTFLSAGLLAMGNAAIAGIPAAGESIPPTALAPLVPITVQWEELVRQDQTIKSTGKLTTVDLMPAPDADATQVPEGSDAVGSPVAAAKLRDPARVFDSIRLDGAPRATIPPDTMGAVGPTHVMTTLNAGVRIQDRTGENLSTVTLQSFWSSLGFGEDVFDPKVLFDPISNRFFMVSCAARRSALSSILLAVSATDNPTGKWNLYSFDGDSSNRLWVDFPYLGYNREFFAMSSNMFTIGADQFDRSNVWVLSKAALLAGGPVTPMLFTPNTFGVAIAATLSADEPTLYAMNPLNSRAGTLSVYAITGNSSNPAFDRLGITPQADTYLTGDYNATQPGSTLRIDTADNRMGNVVYRNGHLWATHSVVTNTGFVAVRWYEIDPADGTMVQQGTINGGLNAMHYYFPSIAVNKNNEVLLGFSGSSNKIYASGFYAYHSPTDEPGTVQGPMQFIAGDSPYELYDSSGRVRWGDYSATMVDPKDDASFWTIQEYAATPSTYAGNWATAWANIPNELAAKAPQVVSVTSPTADGTYGTGSQITVQVIFDRFLTPTGSPKLTLETGAVDRQAALVGVEGNVATFLYTVVSGDNAADLDYAAASSLSPAGSLADISGQPSATLTLPAPGAANSLAALKNIRVDALGPSSTVSGTAPYRRSPVESLDIAFDEAPVNFDLADITLSYEDKSVDLTVATLVAFDELHFRLEGLEPLTGEVGKYRLTIGPSDIKDVLGNAMPATTTFDWEYDIVPPQLLSIERVTPALTTDEDVFYRVRFSESLASFDGLEDLVLNTTGTLAFAGAYIRETARGDYEVRLRNGTGTGTLSLGVAAESLTDIAGNSLQASTIVAPDLAVDNSAPSIQLSTPDATLTGTSVPVGFKITDIGGSALGTTKFYVRPEEGSFSQVSETLIPNGQFAFLSETTDGVFEFASESSDSLGNVKGVGGAELIVALNVKANSPFQRLVGSGVAVPFPMTDSLDVLAITESTGGGALSIGRLVDSEYSVPSSLNGLPLYKEALVVSRSFSQAIALTWPTDPANRNGVTKVDTVWVVSPEGTVLGTYPATVSGSTVTVRGLKVDGTIYVGLNTRATVGWVLQ